MSDYLSKINISRASLTPLGRVFKIRQFFHAILCQINGISRASLTPLGRVFKIYDFFCTVLRIS